MSRHKTSTPARSRKGRPSRLLNHSPAERDAGGISTGRDALLHESYRELTRKHLGGLFGGLFAEFTRLHFHVAWAPSPSPDWNARTLPTACSVCCRLTGTPLEAQPVCQVCGPRQLAYALGMDGEGLSFTCRLGVRNYWLPICVRGMTIGIAYLQALDGTQPERAARPRSTRPATRVLTRAQFQRAGRLLRLIVQHVQALGLADLRKAELTSAGRAVIALEKEQARLHETLQRHLPASTQVARRAGPETHAEQAVQSMLKLIAQDYALPLTLCRCAGTLGMNAAYLSDLFSRAVGVPFKTHLTGVRLERAREFLGDRKTMSPMWPRPSATPAQTAFALRSRRPLACHLKCGARRCR
jgi:AraC-like DNA-binding protein